MSMSIMKIISFASYIYDTMNVYFFPRPLLLWLLFFKCAVAVLFLCIESHRIINKYFKNGIHFFCSSFQKKKWKMKFSRNPKGCSWIVWCDVVCVMQFRNSFFFTTIDIIILIVITFSCFFCLHFCGSLLFWLKER